MRVLDLFSGIGGFSLGLERAGMRTVAFCECEPFCQAVLRKHWPGVPIYDDVRSLSGDRLAADGIVEAADVADAEHVEHDERQGKISTPDQWAEPRRPELWPARRGVDVICGGFPCQDISTAGKGAGIDGERSGLWREFARIIGEVRPRYVIVENVAALLGRGLERVLGDLAALGFDAEWHCIPAAAVGAPHRRDRVWIIAYAQEHRCGSGWPWRSDPSGARECEQALQAMADADGERFKQHGECDGEAKRSELETPCGRDVGRCGADVADAARHVFAEQTQSRTERERIRPSSESGDGGDSDVARLEERGSIGSYISAQLAAAVGADWWVTEPDVGRVAHGIPARVDRLRALGNAVVPQIPELIGRAIMKVEHD